MQTSHKNRLIIIGLTGPLGSGCTTTGQFLSGSKVIEKNLSELIEEKTSEKKVNELNNKILKLYKNIKNNKKTISHRESKYVGLYKSLLTDASEDTLITSKNTLITKDHKLLKIFLRRRELNKVLREFRSDRSFSYNNLNEFDRNLFGINPFIYISFSQIIIKLAIEAFMKDNTKVQLKNYFLKKIANAENKEQREEFDRLKEICQHNFNIDENDWNKFKKADEFIRDKEYVLHFKFTDEVRKETFLDLLTKYFKKNIKEYYRYMSIVKDIITKLKENNESSNQSEYIKALSEVLQDWGDFLRATGNPFIEPVGSQCCGSEHLYSISNEINSIIKFFRYRLRYFSEDLNIINSDNSNKDNPALFIIECFRNPFEVEFFRSRYAEFYLISLYADKLLREKRAKYFSEKRDKRDQGVERMPGELYKLDVSSCVLLSDISLLNNRGSDKSKYPLSLFQYFEKLLQFIALIRSPGCVTPMPEELNMHLAYSMSLMSNCISRKVGAVVIGPKGYIFGAGWNDVSEGQIGCGLRRKEDYLNNQYLPIAPFEDRKKFQDIIKQYEGDYICFKDCMSKYKVGSELKVKRLEFCRALHAEENALLQTVKVGGMPVVGGSIYTTTFPCELCSKKIYQTGIRTIYYTEPYPGSISDEVFLEDGSRNIERVPFEGVKSNSFFKLYKPLFDKKDSDSIKYG